MSSADATSARYSWGADEHLFVEMAEAMSLEAYFRSMAVVTALRERRPEGVLEICPANASYQVRFNPDTLTVKLRGKSVGEVLAMSVDDAVEFFAAHPGIHRCLLLLQDVGLGYLTLGQQSPTLSGGEAQRIKLIYELSKKSSVSTVYVLDEPTVGLHMADVEKLIRVLHRLVDSGNTAVVIEHNLDVIAEADWIIDLGPEGGSGGGKVVFQGAPEKAAGSSTHTCKALADFLAQRR